MPRRKSPWGTREFDDSRASSLPRPTVSIPLEGKVLLEDKAMRQRCRLLATLFRN